MSLSTLTDYAVAQKCIENSEFFSEIISRYEKKLENFLLRLGAKEAEEREDLLQEVFVKAYKNLNEIDEELSFNAWIYRVARNTLYDFFRKKSSRGTKIEMSEEESEIFWNTVVDENQNIPKEFDKKILQKFIREKIYQLPEKKRDIFILFYLEEKSYEEISDILKLNQNSIATHISRGKKLLKQYIENDKKYNP